MIVSSIAPGSVDPKTGLNPDVHTPEYFAERERRYALSVDRCDVDGCAPHAKYLPPVDGPFGRFASWKLSCRAARQDQDDAEYDREQAWGHS